MFIVIVNPNGVPTSFMQFDTKELTAAYLAGVADLSQVKIFEVSAEYTVNKDISLLPKS